MNSRIRILTISCAVVFLAGVVAAFTVDGDDGELASSDGTTSTTAGEDLATDGSTTTAKAKEGSGGGDGSTTTAADESTTTTAAETTTTATPTTTTTTTTTTDTTTTSQDTTTREPTTPGTYTYDLEIDENGNKSSDTSTVTVERVADDGTQQHIQESSEGRSVTVYRYDTEGTHLVSMQLPTPCGTVTLRAATGQGFLLIPTDADSGTKTSGDMSGNGLSAAVTFEVTAVGAAESTARSHAKVTGTLDCGTFGEQQVDATMDSDIRARTRDQLPLESTTTTTVTKPSIAAGTTTVHAVLRQ